MGATSWHLLLAVLAALLASATARRSVGSGSGLNSWSTNQDEGLFATAVRGARDAQRQNSLAGQEWVADPLDADRVRAAAAAGEIGRDVASAVCSVLAGRDPLRIRLRTRPVARAGRSSDPRSGGAGGGADDGMLRAAAVVASRSPRRGGRLGLSLPFGLTPSARRVKAQWSTTGPMVLDREAFASNPYLTLGYDSAAMSAFSRMEVEVTLPAKGGKRPVVVYTFPISEGNLDSGGSYVAAAPGTVKVYPDGRTRSSSSGDAFKAPGAAQQPEEDGGGIELGTASLHAAAGAGLVDPTWARGKKNWWKGRKVGVM